VIQSQSWPILKTSCSMTIISLISNGIGGCGLLVFETRLTGDYNALGFYGKHFTLATCKPFYMLPNITASAYTGFTVHESLSLMPIFSACWHGRANPRVHSVCPPYIYLPCKSYIGRTKERTPYRVTLNMFGMGWAQFCSLAFQ
jgi:hypothetical protein